MSCCPCFWSFRNQTWSSGSSYNEEQALDPPSKQFAVYDIDTYEEKPRKFSEGSDTNKDAANKNMAAQTFTFRELAAATKNFRQECLLGEGGFGRVYEGCLESNGKFVAVKQLDRNGLQGNREFLVEVLMLSLLHHQNLVNLIGYCADGEQRLLVYEFMPQGSLEDHLFNISPPQMPIDWFTRMKIATGAARGLEYLHDKANPPVIYRDLKSSNILLDQEFNPKLSDFGLAKLGLVEDKISGSSRVMGTLGYCAPEYARTGQLTLKSDVYSFGVVLLELITGKRAIDPTRQPEEHNLVAWFGFKNFHQVPVNLEQAQPVFKNPKRFPELADPLLRGNFSKRGLNQAVGVAAMCLQEEPSVRPLITDVVTALSFLALPEPTGSNEGPSSSRTTQSIPHHPPSKQKMRTNTCSQERLFEGQSAEERQRAIAEAKEWGSSSRGLRYSREKGSGDASDSGSSVDTDDEHRIQ